jgi:hypothetical protein
MLFNTYTNTTPPVLHVNGKTDFRKVLDHFDAIKVSRRAAMDQRNAWFYLGEDKRMLSDFCGAEVKYKRQ